MTPLQQQFEILKQQHPNATLEVLSTGASVITIPEVLLGDGWSPPNAFVKFVAPVGYPFATPDCFWASPDLRLKSGAMPQNTNLTPIPGTSTPLLWFSWHASHWNPNRDNLLTYFRVIKERLKRAQ